MEKIMKDRLTFKDASGRNVVSGNKFTNWFELGFPIHVSGRAVDKLAEYEDEEEKALMENLIEKWMK